MANAAHSKDGSRYYVLPCVSPKVFLIVADRKNFRMLQRKHYIDNRWAYSDAINRAFYYTADKSGNGAPTEEILKFRQVAYQFWFQTRLQEKRSQKDNFSIKRLFSDIKKKLSHA